GRAAPRSLPSRTGHPRGLLLAGRSDRTPLSAVGRRDGAGGRRWPSLGLHDRLPAMHADTERRRLGLGLQHVALNLLARLAVLAPSPTLGLLGGLDGSTLLLEGGDRLCDGPRLGSCGVQPRRIRV